MPVKQQGTPEPFRVQTAWTPLAEPYVAPNGIVVETLGSVARLVEIARFFDAKWQWDGMSNHQAVMAVKGESHVFVTLRDGVPQSYGELVVRGDEVVDEYNHGKSVGIDVADASRVARSAVTAFVKAVNAGDVDLAYEPRDDGFAPRAHAPKP